MYGPLILSCPLRVGYCSGVGTRIFGQCACAGHCTYAPRTNDDHVTEEPLQNLTTRDDRQHTGEMGQAYSITVTAHKYIFFNEHIIVVPVRERLPSRVV